MIAVDTNLLVYAHRKDSPWHQGALAALMELAVSGEPWALPWQCIHEFIGVATHPQIYLPSSTPAEALGAIDAWLASPTCRVLSEEPGYWETLKKIVLDSNISGPRIHDARIAALCLHHGVRELWSSDRDFSRFPRLKVRNPLVAR